MSRPHLLLLHGALGASDQMEPLVPLLDSRFQIHLLDLPGHGGAPLEGDFDTAAFAAAVVRFLRAEQLGPMAVFGYSMGGYVALEVVRHEPELIRGVATLATKFAWTPESARRELRFLDPDAIRSKVPYFAELLEQRHQTISWVELLHRTGAMMTALGEAPVLTPDLLAQVTGRVRVMVGDRDGTVTVEESLAAARALPSGELEVLPRTPHPFEKVALPRLAASLTEFFLDGAA